MSANGDLKFLEATVEIKRGQVFDILGHFSCKCVARSERGEVESEEALVQTACESVDESTRNQIIRFVVINLGTR